LISGLKFGFKLQYSGTRLPIRSKNSKSISEHSELVLRKINKEVQAGRIAGPFIEPPFPTLRVSPIFLASKKNNEFRLIHNLSHPSENSLNDFIDPECCSVRYAGIDDALVMIKRIGKGGMLAKADIKSTFRLLKMAPSDFDQLGFRFERKYYFDKCLPMGASISCSIFENFSTALHWFTELQCHNKNILHYLDDFLLGGPAESPLCQIILDTFRDVCKTWGVPLAEDKTVEPVQILTFLGIEFDILKMELRLSSEKISEIKITLELFMHVMKVTLRQLQSLIGLLNFACQVIAPGWAFCRRLVDATCGVRKAHHKIRISKSIKEDLIIWKTFLSNYNGVTVMLDTACTSADSIEFFTDSVGDKQGFRNIFSGSMGTSKLAKRVG
jgi:hypothetical protein